VLARFCWFLYLSLWWKTPIDYVTDELWKLEKLENLIDEIGSQYILMLHFNIHNFLINKQDHDAFEALNWLLNTYYIWFWWEIDKYMRFGQMYGCGLEFQSVTRKATLYSSLLWMCFINQLQITGIFCMHIILAWYVRNWLIL